MGIILIIILIIAGLGFYGFITEKNGKEKASSHLEDLKKNHNITLEFISLGGCIAFCDDEKKIYSYNNFLSSLREIEYDTVLKFEKSEYVNGVSFWALNPTYTEYASGDVGTGRLEALKEKLISIINNNSNQARIEYSKIVDVPNDAASVTVKGYDGTNINIPNTIGKMGNSFVWVNDENICLFSKFNFLDFKLNPDIYKLIYIEKKSIVSVSQEGNVHYTTEVQGGGGGGSSIKGAVIGGVIAGEAGAIIGSRKSTDPITSSTKQIDDRTTNVKILDEYNNFCEILFDHNDYYALSKFIGK